MDYSDFNETNIKLASAKGPHNHVKQNILNAP